jgi:hypothetical protein
MNPDKRRLERYGKHINGTALKNCSDHPQKKSQRNKHQGIQPSIPLTIIPLIVPIATQRLSNLKFEIAFICVHPRLSAARTYSHNFSG